MELFPLPASARYDYAEGWSGKHHGTDIFATEGTPVLAVSDGIARTADDPKGGQVVYLNATDGTRYYYAHLASWEPVLRAAGKLGMAVKAGVELGTVGTTGNAAGKPAHLHFQVSPSAGGAVDPFPLLQAVDPHVVDEPLPVQPVIPPPPPDLATVPKPEAPKPRKRSSDGGLGLLLVAGIFWFLKRRHYRW